MANKLSAESALRLMVGISLHLAKAKELQSNVHRDCLDHWRATSFLQEGFVESVSQYQDFHLLSGALLFFALLGLSGCFITCYERRVRNDLAQPCRELCTVNLGYAKTAIYQELFAFGKIAPHVLKDVQVHEYGGCLGGAGEAGLLFIFIMTLAVLYREIHLTKW
ncbi:hypothetical protein Bca4012_082952 [Brassica carinata]